jgi:hypothetical protein
MDPPEPVVDTGGRPGMLLAGVPMEPNVNRPGNDYRHFEMSDPKPRQCQRTCAEEDQCKAFTYVKPGGQGQRAVCWLKNKVSRPALSTNTISGVKTEAMLDALHPLQAHRGDRKLFLRPRFEGYPLALCTREKEGCGAKAANAWCQKQGLSTSVHFTAAADLGKQGVVKRVGDGSFCIRPDCDGFSSIICSRVRALPLTLLTIPHKPPPPARLDALFGLEPIPRETGR